MLCRYFAKFVVIVCHIGNQARLRGINKGSVNMDNFTDDVASI